MKILFITAWYPTEENPVKGVFVREHAKAVSAIGDEVIVIYGERAKTRMKGFYEFSDTLEEGLRTIRIAYFPSPFRPINYLIYLLSVLRVSQKLIKHEFKPEVIHAHIYSAGVPAVIVGRLYGIPVVISEHWSGFPRRTLTWIEKRMAKIAFRPAKIILPVSSALQKGIESYGIRNRFQVIPNVVDVDLFYFPSHSRKGNGPKRVLFVGALDPVKGIPYLLQALAQLRQKRDDWQLDIVGDGPQGAEYKHLADTLGLAGKVTFHGLRSKPEVAQFMRQADFFVLPSLWENSPCVLLEAMASGLPIVSTYVGGIPEIIHQGVGILVPPGDTNQLSEALGKMMESQGRLDRSVIVKEADPYRPERVGRLIHSVYERWTRR